MKRTLALLAVLAIAPAAYAQPAELAQRLRSGVPCMFGDPLGQMKRNVARAKVTKEEIIIALAEISADPKICLAQQNAAKAISPDLAERLADELVAAELAEREKLEQVLREAEVQATTLRFEVGPPPRNVTRDAGGR
jgi:hypothetical protein